MNYSNFSNSSKLRFEFPVIPNNSNLIYVKDEYFIHFYNLIIACIY